VRVSLGLRHKQQLLRGPVGCCRHGGRQVALEERDRARWVGEHLLEKRVVREARGHQAVIGDCHDARYAFRLTEARSRREHRRNDSKVVAPHSRAALRFNQKNGIFSHPDKSNAVGKNLIVEFLPFEVFDG
jgi:hypothetical protein